MMSSTLMAISVIWSFISSFCLPYKRNCIVVLFCHELLATGASIAIVHSVSAGLPF